ncbi:MAG: AMP-binding protein, partial [Polyangiales bacterium]
MHAHRLGDEWAFELPTERRAATLAVYRRRSGGAEVVLEVDRTSSTSEAPALAACFAAWVETLARQPFARLRELSQPGVPVLVGETPSPPRSVASWTEVFETHAEEVAALDVATGETITYAELRRRALGLAGALQARGATVGDVVAVSAAHGPDTLVAYAATQLAGFVYVPVDHAIPRSDASSCATIPGLASGSRATPRGAGLNHDAGCLRALRAPTLPDDVVAYQIYTSRKHGPAEGGACDPNPASSAHARAAAATFGLSSSDRSWRRRASTSTSSKVLPTWLVGDASSCATTPCSTPSKACSRAWAARRSRCCSCRPRALPRAGGAQRPAPSRLPCGSWSSGEKVSAAACRRFREHEPTLRLVNAYGPTEVTVTSMFADVPTADEGVPESVPIGRPFGACEAFVADWRGLPAVEGVRGELCLAGPQVALGYHDRPAQTAAVFLPDPRGGSGRIYRTGDLVRIRDGAAHFEGRRDTQVKIRGFRIEPGEVEHAIQRDPGVAQVVVKVVSVGDAASLAAFVVPRSPSVTADSIRARLAQTLPPALVPQHVLTLNTLPRRPGGKVDREALVLDVVPRTRSDLGDASPTERKVALLFAEVLGVEVGLDDDFFQSGGDSLRALRVVGLLADVLDTPPTVATLIARGTPRALAAWRPERADAAADADEVVKLNEFPEGRTPLYGVVGLHLYTHVARAMHRPFYGLYVDEEVAFPDLALRIPTLARRYLDVIEKRRGEPPKLLVGFSFGALVAFEMAQQLDARGRRPDLVVMLDPRLPHMLERRPLDPLRDLVAVARRDRLAAATHLSGVIG